VSGASAFAEGTILAEPEGESKVGNSLRESKNIGISFARDVSNGGGGRIWENERKRF
jgi:hypothetical protein